MADCAWTIPQLVDPFEVGAVYVTALMIISTSGSGPACHHSPESNTAGPPSFGSAGLCPRTDEYQGAFGRMIREQFASVVLLWPTELLSVRLGRPQIALQPTRAICLKSKFKDLNRLSESARARAAIS
jgi:hypothetical protein